MSARLYGIASLHEASAYLAHSVLGPRLCHATRTVLATKNLSVHEIFGSPDDLKFHSSMTLFALASSVPQNLFREALDHWFVGQMDGASLQILSIRGQRDQ